MTVKCGIDRHWRELTFLQVDLHHGHHVHPLLPLHHPPSGATSNRDTRKQAQPPLSAKSTPVGPAQSSSSSMASTGHTSDFICRRCKGRGHYARECKSQRVMIANEDGGYGFASDYDEETLALITREEHGILKMLTGMNV